MLLKKSLEKKLEATINNLYNTENLNENKLKDSIILKVAEKRKKEFKFHDKKRIPLTYRCFGEENISKAAKEAKEYVKDLVDPDIFELKSKKRWNSSTKADIAAINDNKELTKTLFEVRNGLRDVNIVKLIPKNVEMGTDSRNVYYGGWNNGTVLELDEKRRINVESLEKAFLNTTKTWRIINDNSKLLGGTATSFYVPKEKQEKSLIHTNKYIPNVKKQLHENELNTTKNTFYSPGVGNENFNRTLGSFNNHAEFNITGNEFNSKFGVTTSNFDTAYNTGFGNFNVKKVDKFSYKSPKKVIEDNNNIIRKIKLENIEKKEQLRKKAEYENPKASKEKISAIVFRRMNSLFDDGLKTKSSKPWRNYSEKSMNSTLHDTHSRFFGNANLNNNIATITNTTSFYNNNGNGNFHNDNNFNMTGFTNINNQTQFGNTLFSKNHKSCFNSTLNSFGNQTNYTNFQKNKKPFELNPSSKVEYFPKKNWIIENKYHPGKWVSFILNRIILNLRVLMHGLAA